MYVRKSYGLICYKKIHKDSNYEFLFINKRVTYAFIEFVRGNYQIFNNDIIILLNSMTIDEKLIIKSFKYEMLWYKCFLSFPNISNIKSLNKYNKFKNKYDKLIKNDSGARLINLINASSNVNLVWELPKGHKDKGETNLNAAIREFTEETSISKYKYQILFDMKPITYTFVDNNVKYIYTYYFAKLIDNNYYPHINNNNKSVIFEVNDIKFLSLENIKLLVNDKNNKNIYNILKNSIKLIKKY